MDPDLALLSPRQAAVALGASESSLKRWVDQGRLGVVRTAGGHRRIPAAEVLRFAKAEGLALTDGALLGATDQDLGTTVLQALLRGDGQALERALAAALLAGRPVAELGDGPVRDALVHIGSLWDHGAEGIAVEHRATAVCLGAVAGLRRLLPAPAPEAPVLVGGAPAGDPYLLPSAWAAAVLAESGLQAVDLGPDTPDEALLAAAARSGAAGAWRAVTAPGAAAAQVASLQALAATLHPRPLVVGGSRLPELIDAGLLRTPRPPVPMGTYTELRAWGRGLAGTGG